MFWFSELVNEEFANYFKNKETVHFTETVNGKIYHETFNKFSDTIDKLNLLLIANDFDDEHYEKHKASEPELYKLSGDFFKEKTELINLGKFSEIYCSIGDNLFDYDISSLNADQLAVALMYLFARMGDIKDHFVESGRLQEFIFTLNDKAAILKTKVNL